MTSFGLLRAAMLAVVASIGVAGCSDGSSSSPPMNPPAAPAPPPAPEPEPAAVDFTTFVRDLFAATADTTEPEPVDETDFEFNDQGNPDAFSGLLSES